MNQINAKVLVLGKQRWAMTDESTGEFRRGCTVRYIEGLDTPTKEDNFEGVKVAKVSFDFDTYALMAVLPGWYNIGFSVDVRADKPTLKALSIEFVEPFAARGK